MDDEQILSYNRSIRMTKALKIHSDHGSSNSTHNDRVAFTRPPLSCNGQRHDRQRHDAYRSIDDHPYILNLDTSNRRIPNRCVSGATLSGLLFALTMLSIACGGSSPPKSETAKKDSTQNKQGRPPNAIPRVSKASLELLSDGEGPRRALRYAFKPGSVAPIAVMIKVANQTNLDGRSLPSPQVPDLLLTGELKVLEGQRGGWPLHYQGKSVRMGSSQQVPQDQIDRLQEQLQALGEVQADYWVGSRGQIENFKLIIPKNANPGLREMWTQIEQSQRQMMVFFPEEEIGAGAKWRVQLQIYGAVALAQTTTYTLEQINGNSLKLSIQVAQSAQPQTVQTMPGVKAQLQRFQSQGKGVMTANLEQPVAALEQSLSMSMLMGVKSPQAEQTMRLEMRYEIGLQIADQLSLPTAPPPAAPQQPTP